jgi:hypothetical protein
MTMEVVYQGNSKWSRDREMSENVRAFKLAVKALQDAWYRGEVPPVYIEDENLNVGPELKEVLSFPTRGALRLSDDLWESYLLTQPTWSVVSGLAEAYNNVARERGESNALNEVWSYVHFLLRWFQAFVRKSQVVRTQLKDLLAVYYTKAEREEEYNKHLELLKKFVAFEWKKRARDEKNTSSSFESEAKNGNSGASSGGLGVVALLGVGAAAFLLFR